MSSLDLEYNTQFAHEVDLSPFDSIAMCDENEAYYDSILIELDGMVGSLK